MTTELLAVVDQTMEPTMVSLCLRPPAARDAAVRSHTSSAIAVGLDFNQRRSV